MPIARVQTPDGRIARIEVPDGATDDQVLQFAASQFDQPEAVSAPPQPAPSLTGEILEPTTKALLRGTAQATVGLPGAFIESAGAERLYGGKYEPDYRQKAIDVLRSEQLAIGLGPNEIQAPSEAEIAQEAERQKVMGTFWREIGARMDKAAPRDALIKDALASIAVPVGRKMQDAAESVTQSELLRDPYRETTPIGQRLREKPVQTVLTEGLEQLPNFAVSAGVGAATRGALGAGKAATFAGAGSASYVLEKGDIFNEGAQILAKQHGGRDNVPPEAWDKLNYFAANHGAFNAALDAIAPSSQINRAVLAKAGIERVMSKAGLKYVGKEFLKDFLLKELPQELAQEVSTIKAVEQATGRKLTDEEVLARLTAVGVGTILPVGAGSVSASVANIRNAQPPAGAAEPEPQPTTPPPQAGAAQPSSPGAAPAVAGITGAPRRVWTAKGSSVDTNLMVVEADQLTTSHDEAGNINPAFPADLQPRDRSRTASQAQIAGMAQSINPELLGDTGQSSSGAPIVGPDGAVESGNARTLAIRQAYAAGRGDNYRQWLAQNVGRFGLDPDQVSSLRNPVLVRMRTTPMDTAGRVAFTQESNQADIAPMAPAELAKTDAARITNQDLAQFAPSEDGNVLAASNEPFLRQFAKRIGGLEAGGFTTADGRWTKQMADRVQAAIFARAYDDERLTALQSEEADPEIRNILAGLTRGAPAFARARAVDPQLGNLNVTDHLVRAADIIRQARAEGRAVEEILNQQGLFGDTPAETAALARFMEANKRSPRRMGEAFKMLGERIEETLRGRQNGNLFGPDETSLQDILTMVGARMTEQYGEGVVQGDLLAQEPADGYQSQNLTMAVRNILDRYNDNDQRISTVDDIVNEVDIAISESTDPTAASELADAVEQFREEERYDQRLAGRGDLDAARDRFMDVLDKFLSTPDQALEGQPLFEPKRGYKKVTDTPEFKKWFGDSKVVDENGEPLVVYHGTDVDFTEFSKEKIKSRFPYSIGFHFTTRPAEADIYAGPNTRATDPVVMPVYVSAKNPLVIHTQESSASMEADLNRSDIIAKLYGALKQGRPYDSVIISRVRGDEYDGQNIIVFSPEQIKSAIGNRGIFDPNDPNILNEPGPGDQIPITGTSTVALDTQRQANGKGTDQLDLFTAPGERPVSNQQLRRIANETTKVGLVQTGTFRSALTKITNASEAAHVVAGIRKEAQENIVAVATDTDGNIVGILRHGIGGPASVGAYPGILLGAIHSMPKAAKVWFAHNHPSGNIRQSAADKRLSDSLMDSMRDTGLEMMGMLVVAPNQKKATLYTARERDGFQEDVEVRPGRRSTALPVTERKFIKIRQGDREQIGNEQQAREQLQEVMGEESGILLTDTQLRPLGYVPMTIEEMKKLRTGSTETGAGAVLRAVHEANATGAFVRVAAEAKRGEANDAAANMKGFFAAIGSVQLHDTFHGGERIMDTSTPSTFYMNPIGPMVDSIKNATTRLRDTLGMGGYGVKIVSREEALDPGLLTPFLSPSTVANNYPVLGRYLQWGQQATEVQEKLRNAFGRRMHAVEEALGARPLIPNWTNADFKRNKTLLWQLMIAEDAAGARMSEDELRAAGGNDAIVHAHRLLRSAYDRALGIANKARAERGKDPINRREGYVPHFFHSYFIVVDGHIAGSARTLREAVRMGNPLARNGHKIRVVPKQFQFPGESVQAAVLGDGDYFRMLGKIEKDFSFTQEEAQEFLDGLARRRGRSRFVGNFLERKGVEGWEQNLDWAHRHYFNMISRYAALDQFKSKAISAFERDFGGFDKDAKGIARYIKNYINDINGNPTVAEELINASLAKVPALGKWLGAYFGDRPALQMASGLTNAVAIAKLGLYNVSAAVVNATQAINTQSLIGPRWAASGMRRWARIEAHLVARRVGFETSAVKDIGLLKQMGVDVAMGLASGAGYSKAGPGSLFRHSTAFFQGVERFNRATAGLGAYYKGRAEGRSHQHAIDYAKSVIERTQFDYSIAETPAFIRRSGPVGQVLFQFKKFPIKQLEFMVSLRGAEKARFWIPFFTLAGYYALPGIELLKNLIRDLFDIDMELEMKKWLMEWAGEDPERQAVATQITRGVLGHAGVDITRRVGAGDFIPSELGDLMGPGISSAVRAAQMAGRQDWIETLRAISTAPGNLVKAIANDGEVTDPWNRDRSAIRLTPAERVMASVGFQPERVSLESDTARIIRYETQKVQRARKEIIDAIIEAAKLAEVGDTEKADARITRIMDRADRLQIGFTAEQMNREIEQKSLTRSQRAWINASPEIKARTAGVMEFHESRQPEATQ